MDGVRRTVVGGLLASAAGAAAGWPARADRLPPGNRLEFEVLRDDSPIGSHLLAFQRQGDQTRVEVTIQLAVKVAFITAYRYLHQSQELWIGDRLVGLATRTDDDGKKFEVNARLEGGDLKVTGSGGSFALPAGTYPTSYWNRNLVRATTVLDTQDGTKTEVTVQGPTASRETVMGRETAAGRWRITGAIALDVTYSEAGEWIGLQFPNRGSTIRYVRKTPLAG
jgi:hypothetical protein